MKKINLTTRQIIISLHILFWAVLFLLPLWLASPGKPYALIGTIPVPYYLISVLICLVLFYGNAFFLYPKLCNKRWWWLYVICFIGAIIVVNHYKIELLTYWFPRVEIFGSNAPFIFAPTVFSMIAGTVYRFVANRIQAERIRQEKEAKQLSMELKFLRSQINPHFLFNVLTNLVSLARKKSDLLEPSLIKLSEIMRYMLYDTNVKKVTLDKEIEYLKNYISLQQLRFGGDVAIDTNFDLAPGTDQYEIEPMLLIPFVENAFKHGVGWIKDPRILIQITAAEGYLTFIAENKFNSEDQQHKDKVSGIGLANVRARLQLLYPNRHELFMSDEKGLFKIFLTLKL